MLKRVDQKKIKERYVVETSWSIQNWKFVVPEDYNHIPHRRFWKFQLEWKLDLGGGGGGEGGGRRGAVRISRGVEGSWTKNNPL